MILSIIMMMIIMMMVSRSRRSEFLDLGLPLFGEPRKINVSSDILQQNRNLRTIE